MSPSLLSLFLLCVQMHPSLSVPNKLCVTNTSSNILEGEYEFSGYQSNKPLYLKRYSYDIKPIYLYPMNDKYLIGYDRNSTVCYAYCQHSNITDCSGMFYDSGGFAPHIALDFECATYSTRCLSEFASYEYNINSTLCVYGDPNLYQQYPIKGKYKFEGCRDRYPLYKSTSLPVPIYIWHNPPAQIYKNTSFCLDEDVNLNSGYCSPSCSINTTNIMDCSGHWIEPTYGSNHGYQVGVCCDDPLYQSVMYDEFCIWGFDEDDILTTEYQYLKMRPFYPINGKYIYAGCGFDRAETNTDYNKAYYINTNQKSQHGTDVMFYFKSYNSYKYQLFGDRYSIVSYESNISSSMDTYAVCDTPFNSSFENDDDILTNCEHGWKIFLWGNSLYNMRDYNWGITNYSQISIGHCCRDNLYYNSSFCFSGSLFHLSHNINGYYKYAGCWNDEPYWKTSLISYPYLTNQILYAVYLANQSVFCVLHNVSDIFVEIDDCLAICSEYDMAHCGDQWYHNGLNINAFHHVQISWNTCDDQNCVQYNPHYENYTFADIINGEICMHFQRYIFTNIAIGDTYLPHGMKFHYKGCFADNPFWISADETFYLLHVYNTSNLICLTTNADLFNITTYNIKQNCHAICREENIFKCTSNWQIALYHEFMFTMEEHDIYMGMNVHDCKPQAVPCYDTDTVYFDREKKYCVDGTSAESGLYEFKYCSDSMPVYQHQSDPQITISLTHSYQWLIQYEDQVIAICNNEYLQLCTRNAWEFTRNIELDNITGNVVRSVASTVHASFCKSWDAFAVDVDEIARLDVYNSEDVGTIIGWIIFAIVALCIIWTCFMDLKYCELKRRFCSGKSNESTSEIELSERFRTGGTATKIVKSDKDINSLEKGKKCGKIKKHFKKLWKSKLKIYGLFVWKITFDCYDLFTDVILSNLWITGRFTDDASSVGAYCKVDRLVNLGKALFYLSIIGFVVGIAGRITEITKCFGKNPSALLLYVSLFQIGKTLIEDLSSLVICYLSLVSTNINAGIGTLWYQSFYMSCISITVTLMRIKKDILGKYKWISCVKLVALCILLGCVGFICGFETLFAGSPSSAVVVNKEECIQWNMTTMDSGVTISINEMETDRYSMACGVEQQTRIEYNDGAQYLDDFAILKCTITDNAYFGWRGVNPYSCEIYVEMNGCYDGSCWMDFEPINVCMIQLQFD
eukprot:758888_1